MEPATCQWSTARETPSPWQVLSTPISGPWSCPRAQVFCSTTRWTTSPCRPTPLPTLHRQLPPISSALWNALSLPCARPSFSRLVVVVVQEALGIANPNGSRLRRSEQWDVNFLKSLKVLTVFFLYLSKDGKLKAVVGASGGSMIPAGTLEVFLNHFAKKMDPLSSVMAPRVYHQVSHSNTLSFLSLRFNRTEGGYLHTTSRIFSPWLLAVVAADSERGSVRELDDGERRPLRTRRSDESWPAEERPRPGAARRGNHNSTLGAQYRDPRGPHRRERPEERRLPGGLLNFLF